MCFVTVACMCLYNVRKGVSMTQDKDLTYANVKWNNQQTKTNMTLPRVIKSKQEATRGAPKNFTSGILPGSLGASLQWYFWLEFPNFDQFTVTLDLFKGSKAENTRPELLPSVYWLAFSSKQQHRQLRFPKTTHATHTHWSSPCGVSRWPPRHWAADWL